MSALDDDTPLTPDEIIAWWDKWGLDHADAATRRRAEYDRQRLENAAIARHARMRQAMDGGYA
jgi:hypothetical protein